MQVVLTELGYKLGQPLFVWHLYILFTIYFTLLENNRTINVVVCRSSLWIFSEWLLICNKGAYLFPDTSVQLKYIWGLGDFWFFRLQYTYLNLTLASEVC